MLMCRTEQLLVLLCIVLHQGTIDLQWYVIMLVEENLGQPICMLTTLVKEMGMAVFKNGWIVEEY